MQATHSIDVVLFFFLHFQVLVQSPPRNIYPCALSVLGHDMPTSLAVGDTHSARLVLPLALSNWISGEWVDFELRVLSDSGAVLQSATQRFTDAAPRFDFIITMPLTGTDFLTVEYSPVGGALATHYVTSSYRIWKCTAASLFALASFGTWFSAPVVGVGTWFGTMPTRLNYHNFQQIDWYNPAHTGNGPSGAVWPAVVGSANDGFTVAVTFIAAEINNCFSSLVELKDTNGVSGLCQNLTTSAARSSRRSLRLLRPQPSRVVCCDSSILDFVFLVFFSFLCLCPLFLSFFFRLSRARLL